MFHLVLPNRPFNVEITHHFVSTSPNLGFTILTQTFASLHYFTVQFSDLEILMNLKKSPKTANNWFEIRHEQMFIWYITYSGDKYYMPW